MVFAIDCMTRDHFAELTLARGRFRAGPASA
jgi:hypothetical protein